MKPFGLTGNMGCGKSTVAGILSRYPNIAIFDCDKIAKEIVQTNKEEILHILDIDDPIPPNIGLGRIAEIIFTKPSRKEALEAFVHPRVWTHIVERMPDPDTLYIVESALLYEVQWENRFQKVITVTCNEKTQRGRLRKKRNMSDKAITERLSFQLPSAEKERRAQYTIRTDCTEEELEVRVELLYRYLLRHSAHTA